jgi:hypothetical protein
MLLDDLKGTSFPAASLSISDAWTLVNDRCKKLFGRTAIDELTADYEFEGKWIDKLDRSDPGPTAFCDFHEMRGKLIRVLERNPEQVLGLRQWSRDLLPQLQPITVLANPSGVDGKPPAGMRAILEQTTASTKNWWWASILSPATTGYLFPHIDSWQFVLQYLSPLTKLMLSGRRHNLMIGPELLLIEHQLERLNYEIYFDGPFEFPEEGDDTDDYYRLTSRTEFKCDFCSTNIPRGNGRLLGPWTIRRNIKLAQACITGLGGNQRGLELFWKDWSHWHFCDKCLTSMRKGGVLEA